MNNKGFAAIGLLVGVLIIGILVSILWYGKDRPHDETQITNVSDAKRMIELAEDAKRVAEQDDARVKDLLDEMEKQPDNPPALPRGEKVTTCLPEQREADFCIQLYQPVCAKVNIQCITTPCDPIDETFSNSCEACKNPLVESYIDGDCKK